MKIQWLGHSCFLITAESGMKILHDPYKDMLGYKMPKNIEVDIVLSSHDHDDHNYTKGLIGDFKFVNELDKTIVNGIEFIGISSYHDKEKGILRGMNTIFMYELEGLKIAHLGDLGHILDKGQLEKLKGIDILFLPVGGEYTIDGLEGGEIANLIKPKIVMPMHYRTSAMGPFKFKFQKVEDFIEVYNKTTSKSKYIQITLDNIEDFTKVIVMDYK